MVAGQPQLGGEGVHAALPAVDMGGHVDSSTDLLHPRPLPLTEKAGQGLLPLQACRLQIGGHLPLQPRTPSIPLLPGGKAENQFEVLSHFGFENLTFLRWTRGFLCSVPRSKALVRALSTVQGQER